MTSRPLSSCCRTSLLPFSAQPFKGFPTRFPESPSLPVLSRDRSHAACPPPLRSRCPTRGPRGLAGQPGGQALVLTTTLPLGTEGGTQLTTPSLDFPSRAPPAASCLPGSSFSVVLADSSSGVGPRGPELGLLSTVVVSSRPVTLLTFQHWSLPHLFLQPGPYPSIETHTSTCVVDISARLLLGTSP